MSGGFTARQVLMLEDLGAEVLLATPSYALNIAQTLAEQGVGRDRLKLRIAICGAEPWTVELRDTLDRELGLEAFNHYGLSEIVGPGVASECREARDGAHIQEDHFLAEVVDPDSGSPLPDGAEGELVFTTLTREALPMLRYRTGDIAAIDARPCVCGRMTARMSRVRGRVDDMLIIRGVNLYPSEVERVLLTVEGVAPHYQLVVDRPVAMDELTVICEPAAEAADVTLLQQRVERAMQQALGLTACAEIVERGAVPRSEGKAVRVIDRRPR
jgi:phenylacetate-CoA ligase